MTHTCPAPGCTAEVNPDMLMCARDWRRVPKPIQRAVWRTWRNGDGAGSAGHRAAMKAAIEAVKHDS